MKGIILILGMPCSGKTTISSKLATAIGYEHASMGDLIRKAMDEDDEFKEASEDAYRGEAFYEPEWLIRLLHRRVEACKSDFLVLDGGPQIDKALEFLSIPLMYIIYIETDKSLRETRFVVRKKSKIRNDDHLELFQSRTSWYEKHLDHTVRHFERRHRVIRVNGNVEKEDVLKQVLSWHEFFSSIEKEIDSRNVDYISGSSQTLTKKVLESVTSGTERFGYRVLMKSNVEDTFEPANRMVFLLKPGLVYSLETLRIIEERLQLNGYIIEGASVWNGEISQKVGNARAHFSLHYLFSKWGGEILKSEKDYSKPLISAYRYEQLFGEQRLNEAWIDGNSRKLKNSIWLVEDGKYQIVNGHIPGIVRVFESHNYCTIALLVCQNNKASRSLSYMRNYVLGSSDPAHASKGSLRKDALEGKMFIHGSISFQNNGFHMSSSPVEAFKETVIWFGKDTAIRKFEPFLHMMKEKYLLNAIDLMVDKPFFINGNWTSPIEFSHNKGVLEL